MSKLSKPVRLLFIGLLLILIGSIVANLLQTDFRRVRVKDFYIGTENNKLSMRSPLSQSTVLQKSHAQRL